MNFAQPCIPSTAALNRFGANGLSTSAITATWISFAVTPTSVASGFSPLLDCAPAVALSRDTPSVATTQIANQRANFTVPPDDECFVTALYSNTVVWGVTMPLDAQPNTPTTGWMEDPRPDPSGCGRVHRRRRGKSDGSNRSTVRSH